MQRQDAYFCPCIHVAHIYIARYVRLARFAATADKLCVGRSIVEMLVSLAPQAWIVEQMVVQVRYVEYYIVDPDRGEVAQPVPVKAGKTGAETYDVDRTGVSRQVLYCQESFRWSWVFSLSLHSFLHLLHIGYLLLSSQRYPSMLLPVIPSSAAIHGSTARGAVFRMVLSPSGETLVQTCDFSKKGTEAQAREHAG